jgi:DNA-binding NtrC family response regulator
MRPRGKDHRRQSTECARADLRPPRILLAAKDAALREKMSAELWHAGYAVDFAADDVPVWVALSACPYDLLVTDRALPWDSEAESKFWSHHAGLSVPTVMMFGGAVVGVVNPSPRPAAWFKVYLQKRFGRMTLLRTVALILGKRVATRAAASREPPITSIALCSSLPS